MVTLVLLLGLFLPRWALIIGYLFGGIPPNPIHILADFILAIFVPRLLIISYIVYNWNVMPHSGVWLTLHIIAMVMSYFIGSDED